MSVPSNTAAAIERVRSRILVRGAVQGVGFRPFVHRQAMALGLAGWVINSNAGVVVEAEGDPERIATLVRQIGEAPPINSIVESIETCAIPARRDRGFEIRASEAAGACTAQVLPDFSTCSDCLAELFDPTDRRYRYPFINCTHCGPRYSIIEEIPYDRARTSMRRFAMCPTCQAEYDNPADRRFHAEPNACADCGPRIALWNAYGATLCFDNDALIAAATALQAGSIVAVKGIGGFHLLVDARDAAAVRRLRERKRREEKPFAVMFPSLTDVAVSCRISPAEEALLTAPARPIVLLRRTGGPIAAAVAPDNPWLGALLPYTPLHHLLIRDLGFPVVATSGNMTDEPIVFHERDALERLDGIADLFLVHDRPIVRPVDDSVARVVCGRELLLRRARGYAPAPVGLKGARSGILAFGGHLKSTVALTHGGSAVLSQHIGDLETIGARAARTRVAEDLVQLHAEPPVLAVCDLHPDYASTRAAQAAGLPVLAVQHHLAHVAGCIAEHGLEPPVLGVAWDGTGFGPDGTHQRVPVGRCTAHILPTVGSSVLFPMNTAAPCRRFSMSTARPLRCQATTRCRACSSTAPRLFFVPEPGHALRHHRPDGGHTRDGQQPHCRPQHDQERQYRRHQSRSPKGTNLVAFNTISNVNGDAIAVSSNHTDVNDLTIKNEHDFGLDRGPGDRTEDQGRQLHERHRDQQHLDRCVGQIGNPSRSTTGTGRQYSLHDHRQQQYHYEHGAPGSSQGAIKFDIFSGAVAANSTPTPSA